MKPSALEARKEIVEKERAPAKQARDEQYQQEKQLVPLLERPHPLIFESNCSPYWKWVLHIDWMKLEKYIFENEGNIPQYSGFIKLIQDFASTTLLGPNDKIENATSTKSKNAAFVEKYQKVSRWIVLCPLCFYSNEKSLDQSALRCGNKTGRTSNIMTHRKNHHKDVVFEDETAPSNQSTLSSFRVKTTTKSQSSQQLQKLIYQFVNDCCLPAITVEKPQFRNLIRFAIKNAPALKDSSAEIMSRRQITKIRLDSYQDFFDVVSGLITRVRAEYNRLCLQDIPFVTVCHDIWQAKDHDVLGVTVMFIDPRNCKIYRIPIGLADCEGHAATDVANLTETLRLSVTLTKKDLCASVNDNTMAAVLAGKYIVGTDRAGKCDMHKAELVLKHATGLVQRYQNRILMDSNPSFIEFWFIFKKFSAWLMSSKAPRRFQNFRENCESYGCQVIKIPLPNDTRVGGIVLSLETLARLKWAMDQYALLAAGSDPKFAKLYPSEEDWQLLSQYEGILSPLKQVAMTLQSDAPGASSAALLEIFCSYFQATTMSLPPNGENSGVSCIKLAKGSPDQWDARLSIDDLDTFRDTVEFDDLLPGPRLLVRRIISEYKHYLVHRDHDGLKAVCCNPLLANIYENMFVNFGIYNMDTVKEGRRIIIQDMVDKFSNTRVSTIGAAMAAQSNTANKPANKPATRSFNLTAEDDSQTNNKTTKRKTKNVFASMRKSHDLQQQVLLHLSGRASDAASDQEKMRALKKTCTTCYDDFRKNCENHIDNHWESIIRQYSTEEFEKVSKKWDDDETEEFKENCVNRNYLEIGKYFDLLGWWRAHSMMFPYLYPSAIIWLAKPATNAFQERIFSIGTWMHQNKLMRRAHKKTNEMRTMECVNRSLLEEIKKTEIDIANGVSVSNSYVQPPKAKDSPGLEAATQQKQVQLSAVRENANGLASYELSFDHETHLMEDPAVTMSFLETFPERDSSGKVLAGTERDESGRVILKGEEDGEEDDDNAGDPPVGNPPSKGVDTVNDKDATEAVQGLSDGKKKAARPTKPREFVANRIVHVRIKARHEEDSEDESDDQSEPEEDSDEMLQCLMKKGIDNPQVDMDRKEVEDEYDDDLDRDKDGNTVVAVEEGDEEEIVVIETPPKESGRPKESERTKKSVKNKNAEPSTKKRKQSKIVPRKGIRQSPRQKKAKTSKSMDSQGHSGKKTSRSLAASLETANTGEKDGQVQDRNEGSEGENESRDGTEEGEDNGESAFKNTDDDGDSSA